MEGQEMGMFERRREAAAESASISLGYLVDWPGFVLYGERTRRIAAIRAVGGGERDLRHYRFDDVSARVLRAKSVHIEGDDSSVAVQAGQNAATAYRSSAVRRPENFGARSASWLFWALSRGCFRSARTPSRREPFGMPARRSMTSGSVSLMISPLSSSTGLRSASKRDAARPPRILAPPPECGRDLICDQFE